MFGPFIPGRSSNNERYKAANSMTPSSSGTYSRRRLMDDSKRSRRESLGPDGPDARDDGTSYYPGLGVADRRRRTTHLAAKEIMFNSEQPFDVTVVINAALWCAGISLVSILGCVYPFMFRTAHKNGVGDYLFQIFRSLGWRWGASMKHGRFYHVMLIGLLTWFVYCCDGR